MIETLIKSYNLTSKVIIAKTIIEYRINHNDQTNTVTGFKAK